MARSDPRNKSRYWHAPALQGLDLLHADFTTHDYAPHVHDSLVVAVTEVGGAEFSTRGKTDLAHRQALLVFNPGEPHSGRMAGSERWRYRSFYLSGQAQSSVQALLGIEGLRHFTSNTLHDPELVAGFLALHVALDEAPEPLLHQELFAGSFGTLFERHGRSGPCLPSASSDAQLLAPVLALLHDASAQPLTLAQMGAVADLTPFQLIGIFKRALGLTPHAYLTQLRLRAALRRLDAGESVVDAALASGFYDQSALNKHFKRTFGMTPLQYVRASAHPRRNSDQ